MCMIIPREPHRRDDPPFGYVIYMISAFLDPKFGVQWLDNDVFADGEQKVIMQKQVTGNLMPDY